MLHGLTEQCLLDAFPEWHNPVIRQWKALFPRWIELHNECVERSVPTVLTNREYQVALYAADGLSNPQIAQKMYLSVSTVKSALSSVYAKLGITRRRALATLLV